MQTALKRHKGSKPVKGSTLTPWPLLTYLKKECVLGGGKVLGPVSLVLCEQREGSWPSRPLAALWSGINSFPWLLVSPDLSSCSVSFRGPLFSIHSLNVSVFCIPLCQGLPEVCTPEVQTQGISAKRWENNVVGHDWSSRPSQAPCWLWTLAVTCHYFSVSVSVPVKWNSNAYLKWLLWERNR